MPTNEASKLHGDKGQQQVILTRGLATAPTKTETMKATTKQVNYLVYLANKVERIKQVAPNIAVLPSYCDWSSRATTSREASELIQAYKVVIRNVNTLRLLRNEPQF